MLKNFDVKTSVDAGYNALVPTTRSIESGNNIRLEIEGEEINL